MRVTHLLSTAVAVASAADAFHLGNARVDRGTTTRSAAPAVAAAASSSSIIHPGLLHTVEDFERIQGYVSAMTEPQYTAWLRLMSRSNADYTPSPQATVCRGDSSCTQNYPSLYRDIAAAYVNALVWRINSTATENADAAVRVLDAWGSTMTSIIGSADRWLAAGLYGYQLANVAELMRDYEGWSTEGLANVTSVLVNVFYPMNHDFLVNHNGAKIDNYWANVRF